MSSLPQCIPFEQVIDHNGAPEGNFLTMLQL